MFKEDLKCLIFTLKTGSDGAARVLMEDVGFKIWSDLLKEQVLDLLFCNQTLVYFISPIKIEFIFSVSQTIENIFIFIADAGKKKKTPKLQQNKKLKYLDGSYAMNEFLVLLITYFIQILIFVYKRHI